MGTLFLYGQLQSYRDGNHYVLLKLGSLQVDTPKSYRFPIIFRMFLRHKSHVRI